MSDKELIYEFFMCYSKFEFALKNNGYCKTANGHTNRAFVNWQKFREDYEKNYVLTQEASNLLNEPPKMQVFNEETKRLFFETEIHGVDDTDLRKVIRSVERIRNNLFHGGKHYMGEDVDYNRTVFLLSTGKIVLDQLSQLNDDVKGSYN